jgi:hypothetical protein
MRAGGLPGSPRSIMLHAVPTYEYCTRSKYSDSDLTQPSTHSDIGTAVYSCTASCTCARLYLYRHCRVYTTASPEEIRFMRHFRRG